MFLSQGVYRDPSGKCGSAGRPKHCRGPTPPLPETRKSSRSRSRAPSRQRQRRCQRPGHGGAGGRCSFLAYRPEFRGLPTYGDRRPRQTKAADRPTAATAAPRRGAPRVVGPARRCAGYGRRSFRYGDGDRRHFPAPDHASFVDQRSRRPGRPRRRRTDGGARRPATRGGSSPGLAGGTAPRLGLTVAHIDGDPPDHASSRSCRQPNAPRPTAQTNRAGNGLGPVRPRRTDGARDDNLRQTTVAASTRWSGLFVHENASQTAVPTAHGERDGAGSPGGRLRWWASRYSAGRSAA